MMLRRHRADESVAKAIGGLIRADLIVIDDIGVLPSRPDAAEARSGIVDAAYENARSRSPPASTSRLRGAHAQDPRGRDLDRMLHHHPTRSASIAASPRPRGSAPRRPTRYPTGENRRPPCQQKPKSKPLSGIESGASGGCEPASPARPAPAVMRVLLAGPAGAACRRRRVRGAVALALEGDHGGVVDESVDERGGDHGVAEDLAPGFEAAV
jgi:hypothetical protein